MRTQNLGPPCQPLLHASKAAGAAPFHREGAWGFDRSLGQRAPKARSAVTAVTPFLGFPDGVSSYRQIYPPEQWRKSLRFQGGGQAAGDAKGADCDQSSLPRKYFYDAYGEST